MQTNEVFTNKTAQLMSADFADFMFRQALSQESFIDDHQCIGSKVGYGNPLFTNLLTFLKPKIEDLYGKRLHETYAFFRIYGEGHDLPPHTDRESCEVSVTITLGYLSEYKWPIFIDGTPYHLAPGEGLIYKGEEQTHWREPFRRVLRKDYEPVWGQVFLHYIEAGGQHDPDHVWDAAFRKEMEEEDERANSSNA